MLKRLCPPRPFAPSPTTPSSPKSAATCINQQLPTATPSSSLTAPAKRTSPAANRPGRDFLRRRLHRPALRSALSPGAFLGPPRPRRRRPRPRRLEECSRRDEGHDFGIGVSRRPLLRRTPVQHALRRRASPVVSAFCCFPIRCIPRANPSSSAPSICPTCARRPCSSTARAIPSARSLN